MVTRGGQGAHDRASSVAESLTEDILIEILSRLLVKSLMQFKYVNKRWQSLISDPGLAKLHLQRLKAGDINPSQRIVMSSPLETMDYEQLDGGIGDNQGSAMVKFHKPKLDNPSWQPDFVGSCDGLVCFVVRGGVLVYNPTIKESRNLNSSDTVIGHEFFHGFGYGSASDHHKIVRGNRTKYYQMATFSVKSGAWREIQVKRESQLAYHRGVYWKGALHWLEQFPKVLSVPKVGGDIIFEGFRIHGANLFIYHGTNNDLIEAWITNEYERGGPWTKLSSVSTEGIPGCK
ncbi:hypothetical protein BT93_H1656 [Corymbia citriodora subsp. variegata]|nr:hypothetical protein BT93_H1656 [Corymbia citriodora subsp. variegata]